MKDKFQGSKKQIEQHIKELVLQRFNFCPRTIFKFVISCEEDVLEVFRDFAELDWRKFVFMPAGSTQGELNKTRKLTAKACILTGARYCDRLHIAIWNQKTGV